MHVDGGTPELVKWTLTDHLNTMREISRYDSQTQSTAVLNHPVYDAYGNVTSETNSAVESLFLLAARPFDSATGLQNNVNRWYEPAVGRWLSPDSLGLAAGDANLYRYVGNRPQAHVDQSGLLEIKVGGYVLYVHRNDQDPFPSQPHAHVGRPRSSYRVNIETGEIFHGTTPTGRNIGKKALRELRARLWAAGLLGLAIVVVLQTPEMVEAAEQGGVSGVVTHTEQVAVDAAAAAVESAAVGGAVLGGAALAGKTVTVGGDRHERLGRSHRSRRRGNCGRSRRIRRRIWDWADLDRGPDDPRTSWSGDLLDSSRDFRGS